MTILRPGRDFFFVFFFRKAANDAALIYQANLWTIARVRPAFAASNLCHRDIWLWAIVLHPEISVWQFLIGSQVTLPWLTRLFIDKRVQVRTHSRPHLRNQTNRPFRIRKTSQTQQRFPRCASAKQIMEAGFRLGHEHPQPAFIQPQHNTIPIITLQKDTSNMYLQIQVIIRICSILTRKTWYCGLVSNWPVQIPVFLAVSLEGLRTITNYFYRTWHTWKWDYPTRTIRSIFTSSPWERPSSIPCHDVW